MTKHSAVAILLVLVGLVSLLDELWMFGLPIGHIHPDLSECLTTGFWLH